MSEAKINEVKLPDIGGSEASVAEIYVKKGDTVKKGDALFMLETDKATMDVPAEQDGTIKELKVKIGDKVSEGDIIINLETISGESADSQNDKSKDIEGSSSKNKDDTNVLAKESDKATSENKQSSGSSEENPEVLDTASGGESTATNEDAKSGYSSEKKLTKGDVEVTISDNTTKSDSKESQTNTGESNQQLDETKPDSDEDFSTAFASPSIRKLARELGANLNKIKGTGEKGRITDMDLKDYVKTLVTSSSSGTNATGLDLLPWPQIDFAKFGEIETKPMSRIKKISGANLSRNWVRIPHVTQFDEADITSLEEFRKALNDEYKDKGVKITPLIFIIKACVAALQKYPEFNASIDNENLIYKKYINIGFAADTPQGLVVPVIKNADKKGILQLAAESANLAKLAREGQLKPMDMQGGTFTISSLGGIGGTAFTPIINAPEVAILGVSKASIKPIWDGVAFVPKLMLPLSLSYDHRIIDGALAARFTNYLGMLLSDIRRFIL